MATIRKANVYRRAIQKRKHHNGELALIIGNGGTKRKHAAIIDRQRQRRHTHAIRRRPNKRTGTFLLNKCGDIFASKTKQHKQTARYMQIYGDYHPLLFRLGNAATFCKEFIRLAAVDKCFKTGIPALRRGMKDARKIIKDPDWKPMPPLKNAE